MIRESFLNERFSFFLSQEFDDFELEAHQECSYDSLSVFDGENTDASSLGIFCGARTPHPLLSSSNKMYLVFKSDGTVSRKGFKARHSTGIHKLGSRVVLIVHTVFQLARRSIPASQETTSAHHESFVQEEFRTLIAGFGLCGLLSNFSGLREAIIRSFAVRSFAETHTILYRAFSGGIVLYCVLSP